MLQGGVTKLAARVYQGGEVNARRKSTSLVVRRGMHVHHTYTTQIMLLRVL